jgi:diadenylate cyclase
VSDFPIELPAVSASDVIQIAILYIVIYAILKGAKGSRFGQALMGFGILAAALTAFAYLFHFDVLTRIVQFLLVYIAVSTVVIFQPEIRRILSAVGAFGYLERPKYGPGNAATPELVVETLMALSERRMGALIAFERGISLRGYEETGIRLDAIFSKELVTCIFTPPMPLHDGGMVMRDGHVSSAHCIFPVSNNPNLISSGMRHRAAVGLSEDTDALVVVVSEETGDISVARNGRLFRYSGAQREESVMRWVSKALPTEGRGSKRVGRLRGLLRDTVGFFAKGGRS